MNDLTCGLTEFIESSITPYHTVENVERLLSENGFVQISADGSELPKPGGRYYFIRTGFTGNGGTSLVAFSLPKSSPRGMRVCASHTDSPCFRIKPNAVIKGENYCRLNVERYGGGINSTWLDRPLAIGGRVIIDDGGKAISKNVRLEGNIIIPNVAIHFNHQLNSGYTHSPASDLVPLFGDGASADVFAQRLKDAANCGENDIIDYDLSVYDPAPAMIWGGHGEYISAPRLDDLQCVYTTLNGFLQATPDRYAAVLALFDCEEVGSSCVTGADSDLLRFTSQLIAECYGIRVSSLVSGGFLLSADNAHAVHPNHPELSDPTNRPILGGGIVLKYNSSKRYITDGETGAFVRMLCKANGIPLQTFANRSDMPGGSTLGNISGTQLPLYGADIGLPQLAMHSAYETASVKDGEYMVALTKAFFS